MSRPVPTDAPDRAALVAACDAARIAWKAAAPFSAASYRAFTTYTEACVALYEYDHPTTEASDDEC